MSTRAGSSGKRLAFALPSRPELLANCQQFAQDGSVARGDTQREFAAAAAEDGIILERQSLPWLCERGHLALPDTATDARELLERIYLALGADLDLLGRGRPNRLPSDFIHPGTATLIEVDESQHFTTPRLMTLDLYPRNLPVGFDIDEYRELCRRWHHESDGDYTKAARGFGVGGRPKQRAYYDSLRDIATPAMGHPPLIRIAAPLRNGRAAYASHRERLLAALAISP